MTNLKNKVAIITGSSRGIGKSIAMKLADNGAAVVINYSHSADKANETVAEIKNKGGNAISQRLDTSCIAIQADVSKVTEIENLFEETVNKLGQVDILVNCAGIVIYKPLVEITESDFDKIVAINIKGTYFTCQQAVKKMNEEGRIVNISSSTTAMMLPTYSAYVATKGAVEHNIQSKI